MSDGDEGRTSATPQSVGAEAGRFPDLRVLALVTSIGLLTLWATAPAPVWALVLVGVAILLAAAFATRSPSRAPSRRALAVTTPTVWPTASMRAVADALPDPCLLTDGRGVVRFVNRAADARFGPIPRGDPLNFRLRATALNDALERVVAFDRAERVEWQEKIPTERWLEAHVAPIHLLPDLDQSLRRPDFVMVLIEDQTEQRRAERMRADFVANASHELRTPLASLTGFIETLQGPARNDAVARERFLGIMAVQAARMKRLIDDLLSLSRIEMKAHVRPDQPVNLTEILRHVGDALAPLAAENAVSLQFDPLPAAMPSVGDRDELVQVFSNLIENAIKYGASGGTVEIATSAEPNGGPALTNWVIAVRDHGPGIPAEHLPRLTERFYRADIVSSRQKQGTGLGLAIVKHILTRHRGRLAIESEVGKGATFTVRLEAASETDGLV